MKKAILSVVAFILIVAGLVSAASFNDIKSLDYADWIREDLRTEENMINIVFPELLENSNSIGTGEAVFKIYNPLKYISLSLENQLSFDFLRSQGNPVTDYRIFVKELWETPKMESTIKEETCVSEVNLSQYPCNSVMWQQVGLYNKTVWIEVTGDYLIPPDEYREIKLVAYWEPHLGQQAVDWQPINSIEGVELKQDLWAWFNTSLNYRRNITTPVSGIMVRLNGTEDLDIDSNGSTEQFYGYMLPGQNAIYYNDTYTVGLANETDESYLIMTAPELTYGTAPSSLQLYMPMDDTAANSTDFSGNARNGRDVGVEYSWPGKFNTAIHFEQSDSDWIDIPNDFGIFDGSSDFTINIWARCNSTDAVYLWSMRGENKLALIRDSATEDIWLYEGGTALRFDGYEDLGVWYMYTATYNQSSNYLRLYVNGTEIGNVSKASIDSNALDNAIGQPGDGSGNRWDGELDEFEVWNITFTTEMVKALYNNSINIVGMVGTNESGATTTTSTTTTILGNNTNCTRTASELIQDQNFDCAGMFKVESGTVHLINCSVNYSTARVVKASAGASLIERDVTWLRR